MRSLSLATLFVALSGWAIIVVAARALDPAGYQAFMVYWGLFFALTGALDGLMQETTRGVTARRDLADAAPAPTTRRRAIPFRVTAGIATVVALLIAATGPLWAGQITPEHSVIGVGLLAVGLAAYTFQAVVCGLLSAAQRWGTFAWLIAIDSGVRLLLALIAWVLGWQVIAFLLITVIGAVTWLGVLLFSPTSRRLIAEAADVHRAEFLRRTLKAMLASGANAVIITGFPVLLQFTSPQAAASGALAATITAVTLTRAPILVPLQRFQPALIVHFTRHRHRVLAAALAPMSAVTLIAAVGAVAAYFLAQPIVAFIFAPEYVVSAAAFAWLTLASGATALLMITGSAALASERHSLYSVGWVVATIVAIALLCLPTTPELRSTLALGCGPLAGVLLHLAVLHFAPSPAPAPASTPAPTS